MCGDLRDLTGTLYSASKPSLTRPRSKYSPTHVLSHCLDVLDSLNIAGEMAVYESMVRTSDNGEFWCRA